MVLYTLRPISIIAVTIQKFWFCPLKLCFSIKTIGIGYYSRVAFDGVGRVCFYGFGRHSINSANCGRLLASTSVSFVLFHFFFNSTTDTFSLIKIAPGAYTILYSHGLPVSTPSSLTPCLESYLLISFTIESL